MTKPTLSLSHEKYTSYCNDYNTDFFPIMIFANQQVLQDSLLIISSRSLHSISSKTDKYYERISSKTENTLERLSRWENKIKILLDKANPEAAQRLFAQGQPTFSSMLEKFRSGKAVGDGYRKHYDEYRDKLMTSVSYLESQKQEIKQSLRQTIRNTKDKADKLNAQIDNTDEVQQFVKERKKELMQQAVQYIGNSKYLQRIDKESYYYIETLRNYKELFSNAGKAEQTAFNLLQKIPAFNNFVRSNSMLASLFSTAGVVNQASLSGLQSRSQVANMIQQQIAVAGPDAQQQLQNNLLSAQSQLQQLKDKVKQYGGNSSDIEMPENFKPRSLKSKTLIQRIELGANVQTQHSQGVLPANSEIALSVGYKLSEKSVIGLAGVYRLGWGQNISHIRFTNEGVGMRSFTDIKLRKSFWLSSGFEMNYRSAFNRLQQLQQYDAWQRSCLFGISKVVEIKSKFFKKTRLQLLIDVLSAQQIPKTQLLLFRVGYNM